MMTNMKTPGALVLLCAILLLVTATAQADNCERIQFQSGQNTHSVEGIISPDSVLCYEITVGAGKTVDMAISGVNVIFSIDGITDAQDIYRFTTDKEIYTFSVGQLFRSVTDQPFTLVISVW